LLGTLASCKKDYIKTPFNQIEEFSVTDSLGNKLKASLSGDSIIVYWPPFQSLPAQVTPQITVSSGAQISPASGTKVTFASTTIYTVTAQDGSKKTYKLVPLENQPAPIFSVQGQDALQVGGYLVLNGQYIIPDTTISKLYLVSSSNKNIPISLKGAYNTFSAFQIAVQLPQDNSVDTGYYKVKLINGKNTTINGPYHFNVPNCPPFTTTQTGQIQRGKTLTFTLSGPFAKYYYTSFVGGQLTLYIGDNFDMVNAIVNSQNNGTVTVVIPSNTPLGLLEGIDFGDKNGNVLQSWFPNSPNITIVQ
jgi:hypothetical protein